MFADLQVPCYSVNGCRKPSVVKFSVEKSIRPFTINRQGLLIKCTPINADIAKKLLDYGYKQLSPFKNWCPVKVIICCVQYYNLIAYFVLQLLNDSFGVLPPPTLFKSQQFPVIFGPYIYFLSSKSSQNYFVENPLKYLSQPPPGPAIPISVCVVGPPKSGKSTGNEVI